LADKHQDLVASTERAVAAHAPHRSGARVRQVDLRVQPIEMPAEARCGVPAEFRRRTVAFYQPSARWKRCAPTGSAAARILEAYDMLARAGSLRARRLAFALLLPC
jgi:hypothetical protein